MTRQKNGFTLVELLLAMAFFSFILLFVTTGFIMINRSYNKGITAKQVQDNGRRLMEQLTREIRVADISAIDTEDNCLGLGDYRYYWSVAEGKNKPARMIKEEGKTCADTIDKEHPKGVDQLDDRVGVQYFNVSRIPGSQSFSIKLVVSTKDTDLIKNPGETAACGTGNGSQYCDVAEFSTVVSPRAAQ